MLEFPLQALVAIFSLLAGLFWMGSGYGRAIWPPWKPSMPVALDKLPAHQSYWNARAALCASIAAICQAVLFLVEHWARIVSTNPSRNPLTQGSPSRQFPMDEKRRFPAP
jgi:hypothetical protein